MALSSYFFCFIFLGLMSLASPALVSDARFISPIGGGRSLLQAKKSCSVDFENKNYTIITSQCKGPQYQANSCCTAFKEFACPFADYINDATTNCADTMFSYITQSGGYPPGLFSSLCREGKEGLNCSTVSVPPSPSSEETVGNNGYRIATSQSICLMISIVLLLIMGNLLIMI